MERIVQMKTELLQTTLAIAGDREFNPNVQLSSASFSQRSDTEDSLKEFKRRYDFLNFLNYSEDYEIRLHTGKSSLLDERTKTSTELLKTKDKIKSEFLLQIEAIVDGYVRKVLP
jgi:hypothetical protein